MKLFLYIILTLFLYSLAASTAQAQSSSDYQKKLRNQARGYVLANDKAAGIFSKSFGLDPYKSTALAGVKREARCFGYSRSISTAPSWGSEETLLYEFALLDLRADLLRVRPNASKSAYSFVANQAALTKDTVLKQGLLAVGDEKISAIGMKKVDMCVVLKKWQDNNFTGAKNLIIQYSHSSSDWNKRRAMFSVSSSRFQSGNIRAERNVDVGLISSGLFTWGQLDENWRGGPLAAGLSFWDYHYQDSHI